jgi:2-methylfumaryl-CoA hydratase
VPAPDAVVPELPEAVPPPHCTCRFRRRPARTTRSRSPAAHVWEDYAVGERIDHVDGMTIEEAEHMMAARLYQNTAKVHFNQHVEREGRFGRRIVYGGHIISLARALSFNGLGNAFAVVGINGGRHVNPTFAGDTIYAWSEVLERAPLPTARDVGCCACAPWRSRTAPATRFPYRMPVLMPMARTTPPWCSTSTTGW